MKALRGFFLAAAFAAVCVLPTLAGPDGDPGPCVPGTPDCPLTPPQSIQVNPHPLHADGTSVEIPTSGELVPVEVTMPMPAPRFVDPLAVGSEGGSSLGQTGGSGNGASGGTGGSDDNLLVSDEGAGASGVDGATAGSVGAAQALALAGMGAMGLVATASPALRGRGFGRPSASGAAGRATRVWGPRGTGLRGAGSRGAGSTARDREERMLPRATWLPGASGTGQGKAGMAKKTRGDKTPPPPPATETPTPPERTPRTGSTLTPVAGGISPVVTPTPQPRGYRPGAVVGSVPDMPWNTLGSKFAGMVRGFAQSECRDSLISDTVTGAGSLARQAGIASVGVLSRAVHGQFPSLERAINNGVQAAGAVADRAVARVDGALFSLANRVDNATSPILGRINAWAAGEATPGGESRGFLRGAWEGTVNRVRSAGAALLEPNGPRFDAKVSAVAGFGAGMSFVGNLVGARTGSQAWRDVGGVGDVISGAANLVGLRGQIANTVQWATGSPAVQSASRFAGLASVAVKASGVLSAVTGVLTMATEGSRAVEDWQRNGGRLSEQGSISAVKAVTGLASTVGGLLLLTPAAPVGGVILAASGIVSAGTWVYENRQRLWSGLQAYQGVARNAATIASVVTQRAVSAVQQSPVGRAVHSAASAVNGFLGRVFGGGGQASSPAPRPVPRPSPTSTSRPAISTPARPAPQPSRPTPSPSPSRTPSPVRSTPTPSHSSAPRSSPARPATPSRSPSTRFSR